MRSLIMLLCLALAHGASAQVNRDLDSLNEVGIDEKLDQQIPLGLSFHNSRGDSVELADLFQPGRPVILSLNYSDCPMLCQLQLNGLLDGLKELSWNAGDEYYVVSVSIDPLETPHRARQTKRKYLQAYGRPGTSNGWHFLTGNSDSIRELADAVGFRFTYIPERKEYAHAAAVMICTPEGRVSRYLYGVLYPRQTLKLSLVESAEGKIGTTLDRVLLFCFHYDAASGRYAPVAQRLMKTAAAVTLVALVVGLMPVYWRRKASVSAGRHRLGSLPNAEGVR